MRVRVPLKKQVILCFVYFVYMYPTTVQGVITKQPRHEAKSLEVRIIKTTIVIVTIIAIIARQSGASINACWS